MLVIGNFGIGAECVTKLGIVHTVQSMALEIWKYGMNLWMPQHLTKRDGNHLLQSYTAFIVVEWECKFAFEPQVVISKLLVFLGFIRIFTDEG